MKLQAKVFEHDSPRQYDQQALMVNCSAIALLDNELTAIDIDGDNTDDIDLTAMTPLGTQSKQNSRHGDTTIFVCAGSQVIQDYVGDAQANGYSLSKSPIFMAQTVLMISLLR